MPRKKKSRSILKLRAFCIAFLLLVAFLSPLILVQSFFVQWGAYDLNTEYKVFSYDNIYDGSEETFLGQSKSNTHFEYAIERMEGPIAIVLNSFDVRTPEGERIVNIERRYGVDTRTGKHVPGYGDKDREGYLFGPRMKGLFAQEEDKSDYVYWHINYDAPATMRFVAEEQVGGLWTYRYASDYGGQRIDQTDSLGHLPGVPEERGVGLYPQLDVWIDPYTGFMVKYADETEAYYYDMQTGEDLVPWNYFENSIDIQGSDVQVSKVQSKRFVYFAWTFVVPILSLLVAAYLYFVKGLYRD